MNYYRRHLGDYARKAGHLTMLEHGAYTLILDAYYDREQPLTRREAIRVARARSEEEIAAVETVLEEFFTPEAVDGETVFVNARAEREMTRTPWLCIARKMLLPLSARPSSAKWDALRDRVFKRDNYTCVYCGSRLAPLECDHVIPVSRGGTSDLSNLVTSCRPCNRSKHNKTVQEWQT